MWTALAYITVRGRLGLSDAGKGDRKEQSRVREQRGSPVNVCPFNTVHGPE